MSHLTRGMKAYSTDLRQKIIETKLDTLESDQKIAERFRVSRSFVNKLVRQYEQSGNYKPLPHGGGVQPKLRREQIALVIQLVEKNNDDTPLAVKRSLERENWNQSQQFHALPSLTTIEVN